MLSNGRPVLMVALTFAAAVFCRAAERPRIDLNGSWQFRLDPQDSGEKQQWYAGGGEFASTTRVPGAWQAQGVGERSGILRNHYAGAAWYRRTVAIPSAWQGKVVRLHLGGALRHTTLFVNGAKAGEHSGFTTPFSFDVTDHVRPGSENTIVMRVANPGPNVSDSPHDQQAAYPIGMLNYIGNWGGIYGAIHLEATEPVWIDEVAIKPDVEKRQATFRVSFGQRGTERRPPVRVEVTSGQYRGVAEATGASAEIVLPMPDARLWSPEDPYLHTASIRLIENNRELDLVQERFGMREIRTRGRILLLNGKPLYLRGYGDDNIEVINGVPPASKAVYLERLRKAKAFGFNAVRFHSMTPAREFFDAADEAGVLVMAELPVAYTMHFLPHKEFLRAELERTLRVHRNHPSFLSLALGNELNLNWLKSDAERKEFRETVEEFYRLAKSIDPDRLILSNDGLMLDPTDMASIFTGAAKDVPTVRHEFGKYYCSLPDISLIPKFTGAVVPTWLEEKKRWVERNGLADLYLLYLRNSQRLQQAGRKYQIERVRLDPDVTGYHYWLIVDYPGGTGEGDSWEEGWFDYFWRPKGVEPSEGARLNSAVLVLIGADVHDRTMWSERGKSFDVFVSNYSEKPIQNGTLRWSLTDGARRVGGGDVAGVNVALGEVARVARLSLPPLPASAARKLDLTVELANGSSIFTNRWSFWAFARNSLLSRAPVPVVSTVRWANISRLYPFINESTESISPDSLLITSALTEDAVRFLESGGKVWLMADRTQFDRAGEGTFFPASGGALGTLIREHPALQGFPHEGFADLQFYNLVEGAWPLALDGWPRDLTPVAGGIRTTSAFLSKTKNLSRFGYILEATAGKGKLLITTLRLRENLDEAYPEAVSLFDRLLRYATSEEFRPEFAVPREKLESLIIR
ncbi:MAG TPA: glycoside hydrolase family 2 TIM barrel-domain containing protein [Bryobacteraceae bacterium]|nr:glycoside hydrolase family 2 TIM barrel-domain containing protein [Bryobacteraceae bacterium]